MKVLITGGAGFLGSWLCDYLLEKSAIVFCIDNLSSGNMKNIKHLMANKKFIFINEDAYLFKSKEKFDFVIHMASIASPDFYQKKPIETLDANAIGTKNLLEIARYNDSVFLYTSTSEVYGDAEVIPTPETYWGNVNPVGVRSCYDEGKRCGEAYCKAYEKQYGTDVRIARIFNTYGPRLRAKEGSSYGRVIPRFIEQALSGKEITVFGDGSQTRSFNYVTDTIDGICKLLFDKRARGETYNIGNTNEISILELAKKIKNLTNSESQIIFKPLPQDDPRRRKPNITKIMSLGYKPKVSLDEGLKMTIEWLRTPEH